MRKIVEVVAAVLMRDGANGREYLLAQRPEGKVYAGYWEFPGGKVEPGETLSEALIREIQEELAVTIDATWPWLCCEYDYPHALVRIKFFRTLSWHGDIVPVEHSGLTWARIGHPVDVAPVLPANGPMLRALALPSIYAITNATGNGIDAELARLKKALADGLRLIQIRDKSLPTEQRKAFAEQVMALAKTYADACILINDDAELAQAIGAQGLHLSSGQLAQLDTRPAFEWVAASCHSAADLAKAATLGLDFALLSPVLPTASHPEATGIGWDAFEQLSRLSPIPIFALGGMQAELLETAMQHGAHGIALMRGWK